MSKWVTRRGLDGEIVRPPELGFVDGQVVHDHALKTVDELIASLVGPDEFVEGNQGLRRILKNGQTVGFIEISADRPPR